MKTANTAASQRSAAFCLVQRVSAPRRFLSRENSFTAEAQCSAEFLLVLGAVPRLRGLHRRENSFHRRVAEKRRVLASYTPTAYWGVDYLLLAKRDGRWNVTHVLWQTPPT